MKACWGLGLIAAVALAPLLFTAAPSFAAGTGTSCSTTSKALVSVAKGQATSFDIHHGTNTLNVEIPLVYAPCEPRHSSAKVEVLGVVPSSAVQTARFQREGDGRAFLHLVLDTKQLADGQQNVSVVIKGRQIATSVIGIELSHQYRQLGVVIVVCGIAWFIGAFLAAAHATASSSTDPNPVEILRTMKAHWLALVISIGPAYAAYATFYDNDAAFTGGSTSLLALAAKVGAAALAGVVITSAGAGVVKAATAKSAGH